VVVEAAVVMEVAGAESEAGKAVVHSTTALPGETHREVKWVNQIRQQQLAVGREGRCPSNASSLVVYLLLFYFVYACLPYIAYLSTRSIFDFRLVELAWDSGIDRV